MYEVKKISAGILPTNTYVLYDSQTKCCVVVDPAFDGDKITKFIEEKGLKPVAVLLTHGHFDHCGGAKPIVEKYGVPVYGSEKDAALAASASKNLWGVFCHDCKMTDYVDGIDSFSVGGFSFGVMKTPGHTPGGVCYFIDDIMFSGDTLFKECVGRIDLPGGDYREMMDSLSKIALIDKNYKIYAGHEEDTVCFMNFDSTLTCRLSRETNERNFVLDKPQAVFVGFGRGYPFVFCRRARLACRPNARTRGLDTICVLNRAVGGILPSAAEWFPKIFFPYNPMIF